MKLSKTMVDLSLDLEFVSGFINKLETDIVRGDAELCYKKLVEKSGKGNEFLGWMDIPAVKQTELFDKIDKQAEKIRNNSEVFVVVGIGGSYLGARAVIEALDGNFKKDKPEIIYAGHNLSEDYMADLIEYLDNKDYSIAVISKSGTTTEPAVALRILKNHLEKKYGKKKIQERIIAVTDKSKGALKEISGKEGYSTFEIPDNVGGRYSVLTPAGLLPIAVAGHDINLLMDGASVMMKFLLSNNSFDDNPAILYAATRHMLYNKDKTIEILVSYNPKLFYFCEWWKQLFGESEGKAQSGIFPASVNFTTDLHSLGQYIQDGMRNIFETVISVQNPDKTIKIPFEDNDTDELNYIAGKRLEEINKKAMLGTMMAHVSGKVPNIQVKIPVINESTIGQMIYFFEFSCAISGYMLGVNPFNQPGVEAYKKNVFKLLGKKGY